MLYMYNVNYDFDTYKDKMYCTNTAVIMCTNQSAANHFSLYSVYQPGFGVYVHACVVELNLFSHTLLKL